MRSQSIKDLEKALTEVEEREKNNTCWNCDTNCSLYSEYQDDGRTFCSQDCLDEVSRAEMTAEEARQEQIDIQIDQSLGK